MYKHIYVCMNMYERTYKFVTKKIHRKRDKCIATRLKFLVKGGGLAFLYDSRSIPIYVTIYMDAISLAIRACTNG